MEAAYTSKYFFIEAKDVDPFKKSQFYLCPNCDSKVTFVPAGKYIAHFKHAIGTPKAQTEACELFMKGKTSSSLFDEEWKASHKLRLVLKHESDQIKFNLKVPIGNYIKNHQIKLVEFPNRIFSTTALQKGNIDIPLQKNYTLDNPKFRGETYQPFRNGPLIFKEIKGEFVSIDYRRVHLSGRFYIVTPTPLFEISEKLDYVKRFDLEGFYVYECRVPVIVEESFERWLHRVIHYTFVPAKAYIDLLAPLSFKKTSNVYEVNEQQTSWLVTNTKEKRDQQRLVVVQPNGERINYEPINGVVTFTIKQKGDYFLYINNTDSEFITLRYSEKIALLPKFYGKCTINGLDYLFKRDRIKGTVFNVSTNLNGKLFYPNGEQKVLPTNAKLTKSTKIIIPKIWAFQLEEQLKHVPIFDWDQILTIYSQHYRYQKQVVQHSTIQKLEKRLEQSSFPKKLQLLHYIRKLAVKVPCEVAAILKEND